MYSSEYKAEEVLLYPVQGRQRNTCFRLQKRHVRFAEYSGILPKCSGDAAQNQASRVVLHSLHYWGLSNHFKQTPVRGNLNDIIPSRTDDDLDGHMELLPEYTTGFLAEQLWLLPQMSNWAGRPLSCRLCGWKHFQNDVATTALSLKTAMITHLPSSVVCHVHYYTAREIKKEWKNTSRISTSRIIEQFYLEDHLFPSPLPWTLSCWDPGFSSTRPSWFESGRFTFPQLFVLSCCSFASSLLWAPWALSFSCTKQKLSSLWQKSQLSCLVIQNLIINHQKMCSRNEGKSTHQRWSSLQRIRCFLINPKEF